MSTIRVGKREFDDIDSALQFAASKIHRGSEVYDLKEGRFKPREPLTITIPYPPVEFEVVEFEVEGETFPDMRAAVELWTEVGSDHCSLYANDAQGGQVCLTTPFSTDGWEDG